METAQFLQLIAENTSDIIAIYSLDWKYQQVSASCKNVLGYASEELIGHSIYEQMHPEDLNRILESNNQVTHSFKTQYLTFRTRRKDGTFVWMETVIKKVQPNNGKEKPYVLAISRDITTRKSSEEMVKKFVEGVQYASDCIVMANPDGKIMYVNPAVKSISGYPPEEVVGQHANFIWGGLVNAEKIVEMWNILQRSKKPYVGEVSNISKDGKTYFTDVRISPIFDHNREIAYFVGISRDITKAKEIDRMKNEFISLASHQLQTPLTTIKWRLEMLMDGGFEKLDQKQKEYVHDIDKSNTRMIELVGSLLNISRIESGRLIIEPKTVSLEDLMLSTIEDFDKRIKEKNIKIKMSFQTNIYDVSVDPRLMRNVYQNLMSNAIKYTKQDGNIEVAIYSDGNSIITRVKDDGYGIPKQEHEFIFQKFYRAKNAQQVESDGTGLGLYLVKAIMEASNGNVWFESEENKGTTFYVSINIQGMQPKEGEVTISS
jgi:PAS domain S-box-containing protein